MAIGVKQILDYDDYAAIPPDGKRWELLEGDVHVTPAPSPRHQWSSKKLQRQLEDYFEGRGLGRVFDAPIDVILTPHDVVQPDLVVVTNLEQISARGIEGPPTLLVEVLSPSTVTYDRRPRRPPPRVLPARQSDVAPGPRGRGRPDRRPPRLAGPRHPPWGSLDVTPLTSRGDSFPGGA